MKRHMLKLLLSAFVTMSIFGMKSYAAEVTTETKFQEVYMDSAAGISTAEEIELVDAGHCGTSNVMWGLTTDGVLILTGEGKIWGFGPMGIPWKQYRSRICGVIVDGGVENVYQGAFSDCDKLKFAYIKEGVKTIDQNAFSSCANLTDVVLPNSITKIGEGAFIFCRKLEEIKLPKNLQEIPKWCFNDCEKLNKVTTPNSLKTIGEAAFQRCYSLKTINIPGKVTTIKEYAFSDSGLISVTIPNSIKKIDPRVFSLCKNLKTVNIPSSVVEIGSQAFESCRALEKITIPNSVKTFGTWIFSNCQGLKEVKLPDNMTIIPNKMFSWCLSLESLYIPGSVQEIGEEAFWKCDNLKSLRVPKSVTRISDRAFAECGKLQKISFMNPKVTFGENVFAVPGVDLVIRCLENSTVQTYAEKNKHNYELIDLNIVTDRFEDVHTDWYTGYVQYVFEKKLMSGIQGTESFQPNANVTKAQVAQVLYNMEGQPELENNLVFAVLKDVYEAEWYANAVAWAYNTGVVTGDINEKKFFPNANVTREQLSLMMYRYAAHKEYDVTAAEELTEFRDGWRTNSWALDSVKWAVGAGIISGVEKNDVKYLEPQGYATRAQMAAILQRFFENANSVWSN